MSIVTDAPAPARAVPPVAPTLRLHEDDNVLVALRKIEAGETLGDVVASGDVPPGHKLALRPIRAGAAVLKYGQVIGQARADIAPGDHVHVHNLGMSEHTHDYQHASMARPLPLLPEGLAETLTFAGYHRPNGRVGTRNYIGILTSVNCSGSVARFIAEAVDRDRLLDRFPNVDGVVPIAHATGCGMAAAGEGYDALYRTLKGYARNPNFGAILLVGLGCEVMQVTDLVGHGQIASNPRFRYRTIQQTGGTRATIQQGVEDVLALAEAANEDRRAPASAAHLVIGLQCGGSDGYSGITANPALGAASDTIVAAGGTTILSETPEIYGAEHLLTRRAVSVEVGEALVERVRWWEDYCARSGGAMDNNPSPGNKRGGLTTILEKSLGAVAKGGTAPLAGVYRYAEPIASPGFVYMDSPGYDPLLGDGPDRVRRDADRLHDGAWLGLRLQAQPLHQAGVELRHGRADERRHGRELRHDPRRRPDPRDGRRDRRQDPQHRVRRGELLGAPRLRRRRVRALADRGDDVGVRDLGRSSDRRGIPSHRICHPRA